MIKFEEGQTLATSSICNSECIFEAKILKRTAKTVTIEMYGREVKRCKVYTDNPEGEYIFPHGHYSMATIFRANRDIVVAA